jgi:hypothetical protein
VNIKIRYRKCCDKFNKNMEYLGHHGWYRETWSTYIEGYLDVYRKRHPNAEDGIDGPVELWLQFGAPFCSFCGNKIQDAFKIINWIDDDADTCDDHTSTWGGAGPDCPIGRREAAWK